MTQDTRRLLRSFGIAVTTLEEALEAGRAADAKTAAADLRAQMTSVTALVESLCARAAGL